MHRRSIPSSCYRDGWIFSADWRSGLRLALTIGALGYLGAFGLALSFDQPFGPVLTFLLVVLGLVVA